MSRRPLSVVMLLIMVVNSASASMALVRRGTALRLRGGGRGGEPEKTGKVWTLNTFTRDHVRFAWELPSYLGSYVGPNMLDPKTIELVMLTVNSINTCPFCTGLHGELARMAKVAVDSKLPATEFAKTFAENSGRGPQVQNAFSTLKDQLGVGKAKNVRALCWALTWGKTTGNTIKLSKEKLLSLRWTSLTPADIVVLLLYGPLFVVIAVLNAALTIFPTVPPWFSAIFGVCLWVPQALHIAPIGLASLVVRLLLAPFAGLSL